MINKKNVNFYFSVFSFLLIILLMSLMCTGKDTEDEKSLWSIRMAETIMKICPDTIMYPGVEKSKRWDYERGVVLQGFWKLYEKTKDERYLTYIKKNIDQYVTENGSIKTYEYLSFNLDNIATGRQLLALYRVTGEKKYKIAADTLRKQLSEQPRTNEGGFWHKKIYPYQMWLDGLYMAEPFYAEYALMFNDTLAFDDVINQFIFIERHNRDPETGLLYHGWDESKQQKWADSVKGTSPNFWGRAMGWYIWALVDVLDYIPEYHPKRSLLIKYLQQLAEALIKFRDPETKLWYQVVDQGNRKGNYIESSCSAMFMYALAKGANKKYLDKSYLKYAEESFENLIKHKVTVDEKRLVYIHDVCSVGGLGGSPYRDGSFEYYISEKIRTNDFKAIGPFILASLELGK